MTWRLPLDRPVLIRAAPQPRAERPDVSVDEADTLARLLRLTGVETKTLRITSIDGHSPGAGLAGYAPDLAALVAAGHVHFQPIQAAFCSAEGRRIAAPGPRAAPLHLPDAWLALKVVTPSAPLSALAEGPLFIIVNTTTPWQFVAGDDHAVEAGTTFVSYSSGRPGAETFLVPHFQLNAFLGHCLPDELAVETTTGRPNTAKLRNPSRLGVYVEASDLSGTTFEDPLDPDRSVHTLQAAPDMAFAIGRRHRRRLDRFGRLREVPAPFTGLGLDAADRLALTTMANRGTLRSDPLATRRVQVPTCPDCGAPAVWREAGAWCFVPSTDGRAVPDDTAFARPAWILRITPPAARPITEPARHGLALPAWRCRRCEHETLDAAALDSIAAAARTAAPLDWFDETTTAFAPPTAPCPRCDAREWSRSFERLSGGFVNALALAAPADDTTVVTCRPGDPVREWHDLARALAPDAAPPLFVAFPRRSSRHDSPAPGFGRDAAFRLASLGRVRDTPLDLEAAASDMAVQVRRLRAHVERLRALGHRQGPPTAPWPDLDAWWNDNLAWLETQFLDAIEGLDLPRLRRHLLAFDQRLLRPLSVHADASMFAAGSLTSGLNRLSRLWSPLLVEEPLGATTTGGPLRRPVPTPTEPIELNTHFDRLLRLRRSLHRPLPAPVLPLPEPLGVLLDRAGPHGAAFLGVGSLRVEAGPDGPATRLRWAPGP